MPVVSDASPLILLARVGKLSQVRNEVMKHDDEASFLIMSEIEKGWIKFKAEDQELTPEINRIGTNLGLHKGEMYALNLAVTMGIKEFLADDKSARVAARILGLRAVGCLGVVMKAYHSGIITRNDTIGSIQKLVKAGLWVSPEVLAEVFNSMEK